MRRDNANQRQAHAVEAESVSAIVADESSSEDTEPDLLEKAGRWLDEELGGRPVPPLLIIIGLERRHLLDVIERRAPSTRVLALEPEPALGQTFLAERRRARRSGSEQLVYLVGPGYSGSEDAWRVFPANPEDYALLVDPRIATQGSEAAVHAVRTLKRIVFGAKANATARRQFAPAYLLNTLRNMRTIARSANVEALNGAFPGTPAILVAAGPSLDGHLEALRHVGDRAVLIAVDTAVRPLLDAGIHPHLAVAVDPSSLNGRHLRDLSDPRRTFLVGEGSLDSGALATFSDRTFIFSVSDHHPWPWLRSHGLQRGQLRSWGSVLTSAFDLALKAGCDPIVFAGADLAYSQRRPCCRGTTVEEDWANRVAAGDSLPAIWRTELKARGAITVDKREAQPTQSAPHLIAFRDWLVEQIDAQTTTRFINATGDGVLDARRIEHLPLPEVVASLPTGAWPGLSAVRAAWARGRSEGKDARPLLRQLLAVVANGAQEREPLASWRAFAGSGLSRNAVTAAVRGALADPLARGSAKPTRKPRSALPYAPERVALIRAAIAGTPSVAEVLAPTRVPNSAVPILPEISARLDGLLKALLVVPGPLLTDEPGVVDMVRIGGPASRSLPWNEQSRALVLEYEAALADSLVSRFLPEESRLMP